MTDMAMTECDSELYDISVIVPCYQEENHLRECVQKIYNLLNVTKYRFEMIFVDDCSKDKTRDVIISIVKDFSNAKYIFHETNVGRGGAFLDGVKISKGKYVGFLDIDLEVSCIYLLSVIDALQDEYDIAIVRRNYELYPSFSFILRHILSVGYKLMVNKYLGIPMMDTETGFKFFKRECIMDLSVFIENKRWFFDTEVIALAHLHKYKIKEVEGLYIRRKDKGSTVKLFYDTIEYLVEIRKFKHRMRQQRIVM